MSSEDNKSKQAKTELIGSVNKNNNINSELSNLENNSDLQETKLTKSPLNLISSQDKDDKEINSKKNMNSQISTNSLKQDLNILTNESIKCNYFQSKKINSKDFYDKPCCCCTKTKCIKKYCECFANNKFCVDCHCVGCLNKNKFSTKASFNNNFKESSENDKITCTCAKSNCNKKYCDCYKAGKKCNEKCKCINCLNNSSPTFTVKSSNNSNNNDYNNALSENNQSNDNVINNLENNKFNIDLNEEQVNSSFSDESSESYKIQRISVFISQYQTLVNVERFTKEDMKLISKKRLSSEEQLD